VRYQLTAGENIGFGDVARLEEPSAIAQAARDGGALEVLEGLPRKEQTLLGRVWIAAGAAAEGVRQEAA
jgi:ATP-binding cassette, subfamily B, bacterial